MPALRTFTIGIVAGLGATAVMNLVQRTWTHLATGKSGAHGAQSAKALSVANQSRDGAAMKTANIASEVLLDQNLHGELRRKGGTLVHYSFGTATGVVYVVLARYAPRVTAMNGLGFGVVLWMAADLVAVPKLGLSRPLTGYPAWVSGASLTAHLAYGVTLEWIRKTGNTLLRAT